MTKLLNHKRIEMLLKVAGDICIYSGIYSTCYRCKSRRLRLISVRSLPLIILISFNLNICDPRIALLLHRRAAHLLISIDVIYSKRAKTVSKYVCLSLSTQRRLTIDSRWYLQARLIRVSALPSFTVTANQQLRFLIIFTVVIMLHLLLWIVVWSVAAHSILVIGCDAWIVRVSIRLTLEFFRAYLWPDLIENLLRTLSLV